MTSDEIAWMQLKDQYSELAKAAGFSGDNFWGDPLVSHEEIVTRIKELAEKAWKYDDLSH